MRETECDQKIDEVREIEQLIGVCRGQLDTVLRGKLDEQFGAHRRREVTVQLGLGQEPQVVDV